MPVRSRTCNGRDVCVGGTFDRLHIGHRALLDRAFKISSTTPQGTPAESSGRVFIGITEDCFLRGKKTGGKLAAVQPFGIREKALRSYLKRKQHRNFEIVPLKRRFGIADKAVLDAIVVSVETEATAHKINAVRTRKGLEPLCIVVVEKIYASDLIPVSSTRIRSGQIDSAGRRLRPLVVAVGSSNPNKVNAVKSVLARATATSGLQITVKPISVDSGVPEQPFHAETVSGAINRARKALVSVKDADMGIGIEAGLFYDGIIKTHIDVQYCAITDCTGNVTVGHGGGFVYPGKVLEQISTGSTVSEAINKTYGTGDLGEGEGAVGFLSKGLLNRQQLTEWSVIMALIPRLSGKC